MAKLKMHLGTAYISYEDTLVTGYTCGRQGIYPENIIWYDDMRPFDASKITCERCKAIIENTNFKKATDFEWSHDHGLLVYNDDSGKSVLIAHYDDFGDDVERAAIERLKREGLEIPPDLFKT